MADAVDDPDITSIIQGVSGPAASSTAPDANAAPPDDPDIDSIIKGVTTPAQSDESSPVSPQAHPHAPQPLPRPTQFHRAGTPPPPNTPELTWGQTAEQAVHNLPSSAAGVVGGLLNAVHHPIQTLSNIGQVGSGFLSQGEGALGMQQDPAAKAKTEALAKALENHYIQGYGSVKGFKQNLATDPVGVAMDASTLLGGAGAAADAANMGRTAAVLGKVGSAVDPIANAMRVASVPAKLVANPLVREAQAVTTGVPASLLKVATQAGSTTDPALRAAFLRHFNGQGTATEYLQTAQKALGQIKQNASDTYLAGKGDLINQPVDFSGTYKALDQADSELGMGAKAGFPAAKQALASARDYVDSVAGETDPAARNLVNADALKQQIWDLRDSVSNGKAQQYLGKVYNAVKGDISATDPQYQALMESYQDGLNNINDVTKTFGLGRNPAATASLAKGLRAMKGSQGENILSQLSEVEPTLPYMMAGSALSPWSAGGARNILEAGVSLPWAVAMHNPLPLLAQAAIQSPKAMGSLAYGAGAIGKAGAKAAASPLVRGAYYAGRGNEESAQQPAAPTAPATAPSTDPVFNKMLHIESGNQQFRKNGQLMISPKGAVGAAQIMPETGPQAAALAGETWDPTRLATDQGYNTKLGYAYYKHLADQFGDPILGAAAYNAGPAALQKALAEAHSTGSNWLDHLPAETQNYVRYVSEPKNSATGGRIQLATGGSALSHEQLVDRLMTRAEQAKKASDAATKPLLQVPDNAIVKALDVAQRAI